MRQADVELITMSDSAGTDPVKNGRVVVRITRGGKLTRFGKNCPSDRTWDSSRSSVGRCDRPTQGSVRSEISILYEIRTHTNGQRYSIRLIPDCYRIVPEQSIFLQLEIHSACRRNFPESTEKILRVTDADPLTIQDLHMLITPLSSA